MKFVGKEKAMPYSLRFILVALTLLAGISPLKAQLISSSIVGQVTDSTGAMVPGVEITLINEGTGIAVHATTGAGGIYTVPDLQAGVYEVRATKTGFRTYHGTGVQLVASQTVRVDIRLEVGNVKQEINVTAAAPLVNTEGAEILGEVATRQITELPLQQQSIDGLMLLAPGAQNSNVSFPQTGGATPWGGANFTMNGVTANDPGNASAAYSYGLGLISLPAVESMQELKVDAFDMNAEYRNLLTITMVTKGGSNKFHGEAYEYNENAALNANTFLNNASGIPRPAAVRNQFAANLGGPILRNKLFFFGDYAGFRDRSYSGAQLNFPTAAMRGGDFSALCSSFTSGLCTSGTQLYNPFTGQAFANNQIPGSMISSQAQTVLKYIPALTRTFAGAGLPNATWDYYAVVPAARDTNNVDVRLDYRISDNDSLYGVYSHITGSPWDIGGTGTPPTYGQWAQPFKTVSYSLVETHTFNAHTLNDFRLAYFSHPNKFNAGMTNRDLDPRSLFPQLYASPNRGLPSFSFAGYPTVSDWGNGYWDPQETREVLDNFTYVRGHHTIRAGVDVSGYRYWWPTPNASLGKFTFSGQWTGGKGWPGLSPSVGNAFADFLLGTADSSQTYRGGVLDNVYSSWDDEFYAQDVWQASPHLTLTYGLRYSYQSPWKWQDGFATFWDSKTNQLALPEASNTATLPPFGADPVLFSAYPFTTTKALGLPLFYRVPDKHMWGPRFGFAYRPSSNNRTVIRGGYGIYYSFKGGYVGGWYDAFSPPWVSGIAGAYTGSSYSTRLSGNITSPYLPDITFSDPFPASMQTVGGAASNPTIYSEERNFQNAMAQQWNLTLEHQFAQNWSGRISYVGSKTTHVQWYAGDFNIPTTQTPNLSFQQQRPFQPWGSILTSRSGGDQNYHQLQLEAIKRFGDGFSFQAEYQWTSALDNVDWWGNPEIPGKPDLDYGNGTLIRRHLLVFNYIYELPFGKGKPWLSHMGRAGNALVGGWQVSGITTYGTGLPTGTYGGLNFQVPASYVGWWGGRPDRVSGTNLYHKSGSHDVISGVSWFNPSAFAPPRPWTWGDASRNCIFGPGYVNWDISAARSFQIKEHIRFQLRGDFLNALNHFTPGDPATTIADTRDGGPAIATTGKIYGGSGSRVIQVGGRIVF